MTFDKTMQSVANRGKPSAAFLAELVGWGAVAPDDIFAPNAKADVYASVVGVLGPWRDLDHRRAVMLEVLRVLAGFESSWNWAAGSDPNTASPSDPETLEAGAWQVSANSMNLDPELKALVRGRAGSVEPRPFQDAMKRDHPLAMEYIARLLRHTVAANGPVLRHEIDPWLSREAVAEFEALLAP